MKSSYGDPPFFVPRLFGRVLAGTCAVAALGLVAARAIFGPITTVDLVGTVVCTPLVAYLVHLVLAPARAPR
jgi:hypothetical protein